METKRTPEFDKWLKGLRDQRALTKIMIRIARLEGGLFGDAKFFDGIGELRIDFGPGYRVYFLRRGQELVILLCGGDKATQRHDIAKAREIAERYR
jgi:putative addiction module killer protein